MNTLSEFSISNGNSVLFDKNTIDMFIDRWRDYFPEIDERYCPIFQNIKNNYISEGYEIYYPFFFKKTLNFLELFDDYKYLKLNNLDEIPSKSPVVARLYLSYVSESEGTWYFITIGILAYYCNLSLPL